MRSTFGVLWFFNDLVVVKSVPWFRCVCGVAVNGGVLPVYYSKCSCCYLLRNVFQATDGNRTRNF